MVPSFFPYRHNVSLLYPRKTSKATQETCFDRCVEPQCQAWCRTPLNRYIYVLLVYINNPTLTIVTNYMQSLENLKKLPLTKMARSRAAISTVVMSFIVWFSHSQLRLA